jgi:ribosome-associated protein
MPGKAMSDLYVDERTSIPMDEIQITAIRAQGAGGQNVNKVSTAIHLRFDIGASRALDDATKSRLLAYPDRRVTDAGILVIKAQGTRSQEKNRDDALRRLAEFIRRGTRVPAQRVPTRPSQRAKAKRVDQKTKRGKLKQLRGKIED